MQLVIDGLAIRGLIVKPPEVKAADAVGGKLFRQLNGAIENFTLLVVGEVRVELIMLRTELGLGAPGQSTLKSGLAMSVTRRLFFFRRRCASAISLASRLTTFLFHMVRSSIHSIPNCWEATSQAWPKSCEISSLMTAILKGDLPRRGVVGFGRAIERGG